MSCPFSGMDPCIGTVWATEWLKNNLSKKEG